MMRQPKLWSKARIKAAQLVVVVLLTWPPIHAILCELLGFSSWRLFGWGMYAQPYPESFSKLTLVWLADSSDPSGDMRRASDEFDRLWRGAPTKSCLTVLVQETGGSLRMVSTRGLCADEGLEGDFMYFMHFRSLRHLASLSRRVARLTGSGGNSRAVAIVVHQRVHLKDAVATTETEVFQIPPPR